MAAGLFEEPFDFEKIDPLCNCLSGMSERFLTAAVILCGQEKRWDAATDQLERLAKPWLAANESDEIIYRLAGMLFLRASTQAQRDRLQRALPFIDPFRMKETLKQIEWARWFKRAVPLRSLSPGAAADFDKFKDAG